MTIQEILEDLGVEFLESGHHHCRSGWIQCRTCPYCQSDNFHLGFNLEGRFFVCWKCRWHPTVETLLKLGAKPKEANSFYRDAERNRPTVAEIKRPSQLKLPVGLGELLPAHRSYLKGRGFDPGEIQEVWGIKGLGILGRLPWRIFIPVVQQGRTITWTTRAIGSSSPRYISASAEQSPTNIKECVYGLDYCQHSIVIVEGPLDAWAIGPGAGALFGIAFTPAQVRKLADIPYRYICFDSTPDAQQQARELAGQLSVFPGETHNVVLQAKDPAEAGAEELNELREYAKLLK